MTKRSTEWHERRCRWEKIGLDERYQRLESARRQYEAGLKQYRKDYDEWVLYKKEIAQAKLLGITSFNRGAFIISARKKKRGTENGL